ncbi:1-deoxy-D-xylulose 5-phosphate reductoisomerase 2 [Sporosarcina sp. NCCP-2222]|uniref:1-deoxy-D-xylulose-5-phosphate reductoisomerase n=1 Tax=Sporosarcina sp. NCCP-2222 TaxID=2935073 RepID=UPI0020878A6B|nr:1-deoxy-D-xylulose-5-phosphate reductoisomerase [Sporosarcina sp. NCCP-2222]GKV55557.1 1-deoxy-D-xylulose 5-phosphate reductoisomerase 2 [Sporosarcina sp. NCCP-2222]
MVKRISLLGATGSIGVQTLDIIESNRDKFQLVSFSAGTNITKVREIARNHQPEIVSVLRAEDAESLQRDFPEIRVMHGKEGLMAVACEAGPDLLVNAVIGSVGLEPTLKAIQSHIPIAIANKETLVAAGEIVMREAAERNVPILPVDSEHSALFQSLNGENPKRITRLILTASGGSFRDRSRDELAGVTVEQALAHPNWSMGNKLTIDSATMMNKGLEVIEAHHLFNMPFDQIDCLLHKESIIHSMVEFEDTSIMAQLGSPDMRVPIQYAMTYPDRIPMQNAKRLRLEEFGLLHFEKMDFERFKALSLAYDAGREGGTMPAAMNAANEVAVQLFMEGRISFLQIEELVETVMEKHQKISHPDLETILQTDAASRKMVYDIVTRLQ